MSIVVDHALPWVFGSYLLVVVSYLTLQTIFAERSRRHATTAEPPVGLPSVDVIIPCYNESPAVLAACLNSIAGQDYPGELAVYVVDDGSPDRAELDAVYQKFCRRPRSRLIILPENKGKRYAQVRGIMESRGQVVISVDSDTVIAPDGVRRLVAALDDPRVGAAMGQLCAANASVNWLTRIIDRRYWYACNQERAAQSRFDAVLCCSGPFSAYRRSVLEPMLDEYLNQTFRRRPTTHGEDRHLTNLVLGAGKRTAYVAGAVAATVVPERLRPFLRQQLRWNRSVYRDMFTFASRLPTLGWYLVLDAIVQIFAPALLALSVVLLLLYGLLVGTSGLAFYGAGLVFVALAYCAYGAVRTRDPGFISLALYGLLHLVVLIPVRIRALFTLTDDRWGQRSSGSRHDRFGPDLPQERSPSAKGVRQRSDHAENDHAQA